MLRASLPTLLATACFFLTQDGELATAQSSTRSGVPVQTFPQGPTYTRPSYGGAIAPGSGTRGAAPSAGPSYGGNRSGSVIESTTRTQPTFENRFWKYLRTVQYRNWAPAPGQAGGAYEGQSPHGAFLKMYLNRTAVASPQEMPFGSIVVKENYGPDQKTLMAITVMYRTSAYNREGGGWYWVKYRPTGEVDVKQTETGGIRLAGKVKGCIDCHEGADGGDYLFFND